MNWNLFEKNPKTTIYLAIIYIFLVLVTASILLCYNILDIPAFLIALFGLSVLPAEIIRIIIRQKNQTILISFTCKYMLEQDESKIDELLGILIAGTWERLRIDPIEEFFKCISDMCLNSDFETRRRITEALPALFEINLERSKNIVDSLRVDWDDERWKSDNRRRVIESLTYILNKDENFVKKNLVIKQDDEIYTIFAIIEVLDQLKEKGNLKEAEDIFNNIKNELIRLEYSRDEIYAISKLWEILSQIRHDPPNKVIKIFEDLKDYPNLYVQICVARNIKHLFDDRYSEDVLNLMEHFLQKDKYIRRPIAKEMSMTYLLKLLSHKNYGKRAKEIIWKLINDKDDIIRITAFDYIDKILEIDEEFGKKILVYIAETDKNPKLIKRSRNIIRRYEKLGE